METCIRRALDKDINVFTDFVLQLSRFNRSNHKTECKYDDYELVRDSIRERAEETFCKRNENTLILIAEVDGVPMGYALGRIYEEEKTADNGTGLVGLFDELFVDDRARGLGIGKRLIDEVTLWMKEEGISRIKLHAYSWNENAKKLYEKYGFREYAVSYEKFI